MEVYPQFATLLVLDPHLQAAGPIYGSHPIGLTLFHWTLDFGPHLKWP
jgi:hypothetical protein